MLLITAFLEQTFSMDKESGVMKALPLHFDNPSPADSSEEDSSVPQRVYVVEVVSENNKIV